MADLIETLRAAEHGSADLDLLIGKALGEIHADAVLDYQDLECGGWQWTTPARRAWDGAAWARTLADDQGLQPCPADIQGQCGFLDAYTRSLDVIVAEIERSGLAVSLVVFPGDACAAVANTANLEGWTEYERHPDKCIALCIALLQYRETNR